MNIVSKRAIELIDPDIAHHRLYLKTDDGDRDSVRSIARFHFSEDERDAARGAYQGASACLAR